jgi:hypothetical protein
MPYSEERDTMDPITKILAAIVTLAFAAFIIYALLLLAVWLTSLVL